MVFWLNYAYSVSFVLVIRECGSLKFSSPCFAKLLCTQSFPKHSADFPSVSTNGSKRKRISLPAKHPCLKEGGTLCYKNKRVSQVGWSPYLTLATPWTLCRLWFELHVGTFVFLNQTLGTDLSFSQRKKKYWSSGFFKWLTVALLMFLIWSHIGMQNCLFPPTL